MYPDYVEAGSVYEFCAKAYSRWMTKPDAIDELERYAKIGGRNPDTLKKLASSGRGRTPKNEAAAILDRLNYIDPVDGDLHRQLGDCGWRRTTSMAPSANTRPCCLESDRSGAGAFQSGAGLPQSQPDR